MRVYVASSWRNTAHSLVVCELLEAGHDVYDFKNPSENDHGFHWSEIDLDWQKWQPSEYRNALTHPVAERGFNNDFNAMQWADCCVLVLPCGRSAHTEAGWMKGNSKKCYVLLLTQEEPELMYKVFDGICLTMDELLDKIGRPREANEVSK